MMTVSKAINNIVLFSNGSLKILISESHIVVILSPQFRRPKPDHMVTQL